MLVLVLAEGFSPGTPVFLPLENPSIPKYQVFNLETVNEIHFVEATEIPVYLFYLLFIKLQQILPWDKLQNIHNFVDLIFLWTGFHNIWATR